MMLSGWMLWMDALGRFSAGDELLLTTEKWFIDRDSNLAPNRNEKTASLPSAACSCVTISFQITERS